MTTARLAKIRMRAATAELAVARSGIKRGFASGMALACLPPRLWARIGALAGGGAALLARSMLTPMIAGALMARKQQPPPPAAQQSAAAD